MRQSYQRKPSQGYKKVTCCQCGAEITKRSSKAVGNIPTNGSPAPERMCKDNLNTYPDECRRFKQK
jgi:hypothetical protein